jgi:hypothetical protein
MLWLVPSTVHEENYWFLVFFRHFDFSSKDRALGRREEVLLTINADFWMMTLVSTVSVADEINHRRMPWYHRGPMISTIFRANPEHLQVWLF